MSDWPHQTRAIEQVKALAGEGKQRICLTSPTGGGKSRMMRRLIEWNTERGGKSLLLTNRTMLFDQTYKGLCESGIDCGARAAGYDPAPHLPVQIAMVQTEEIRVHKSSKWSPHEANLVLVDEAHNNKGASVQKILDWYVDRGAVVTGFTATPLEIGGIYTELVVAGTNSELRACGAHVPCRTYAPDEPDCRDLKPQQTGEFSEGEVVKRIMTPTIMDRVFDRWSKLNPDAMPTLLFAPGVRESIWFAEQFYAKGVRSAHIDGNSVWLDGREYANSQAARDDVAGLAKDGKIKVVSNRFVLREGIDWPWIRVGIMATIFGALTSYLQSGGRIIRKSEGKDECLLIDHGGNWWRHGSLNADREWKLGDTNNSKAAERAERLRDGKEPEPITCPQCGAVRLKGDTCATCGFRHSKRSRPVIQKDGSVRLVEGKIFKPRTIRQTPDTEKHWEQMYFRARRAGMTFRQAEGLFFREQGYWPPKTLPRMPKDEADWYRKVAMVTRDRLIEKAEVPVS